MSYLNQAKIQYSLDDISIIPAVTSEISSRSECNPYVYGKMLPIFASPMAGVVSVENFEEWGKNGVTAILPRNIDLETRLSYTTSGAWCAYSLTEFETYFLKARINNADGTTKVLIDIANGHMRKIVDYIKEAKAKYNEIDKPIEIMVGNIANPKTFEILADAGADFIRVGVGSGNMCSTSVQTPIHYGMATLLAEIADIKEYNGYTTQIIADGGISTYRRAILALALGADYVMIGTAFAKCWESAGDFILYGSKIYKHEYITNSILIDADVQKRMCDIFERAHEYELLNNKKLKLWNYDLNKSRILTPTEKQKKEILKEYKGQITKEMFGMSTKKAQKLINKDAKLKTSEGVVRIINIEYTLAQWIENFTDYLKSTMSYCGKRTLNDFIANIEVGIMSPGEWNAINK